MITNLHQWGWFIIPLIIWEIVWKGIALWRAAKHNQFYWFIVLFIINTAGILPIIYLKFFQRKEHIHYIITP